MSLSRSIVRSRADQHLGPAFEPTKQILVVVEPILDDSGNACEYVATFPDGVVSISGEQVEQALQFLKEQMATQYEFLEVFPQTVLVASLGSS